MTVYDFLTSLGDIPLWTVVVTGIFWIILFN